MNPNETRTLWISVFAALFAVFLLYSYTQEKSDQLTRDFGTMSNVVVAVKDINEMQSIDETMLRIEERPSTFVHVDALNNPELAVGKVALAPIKKNEVLLQSKMLLPGPVTGLSLQVNPGKRAVTIPIDEMRGVGKLIKPGDRVDIVGALTVGSGVNQKKEVRTLLQDIPILATGVRIANELPRLVEPSGKNLIIKNLRSDTNFNNVTVEVSPKQAQSLIYILSTSPGSLFLTLRHPSDVGPKANLPTTTVESLRGNFRSASTYKKTKKRRR